SELRFERLGADLAHRHARVPLSLAGGGAPGDSPGARLLEHVFDRLVVLRPFAPLTPVVFRDLPALVGLVLALFESLELFFFRDVEADLYDGDAVRDEHLLELVDLDVRALPLGGLAVTFDTLDQHAPVPAAVEDGPSPRRRKLLPKAIEVVLVLVLWG